MEYEYNSCGAGAATLTITILPYLVIVGFIPAIHGQTNETVYKWIPATSAGMTENKNAVFFLH